MCGIAGIVDWGGRDRALLEEALARMDQAVAPRGPDGEGREIVPGAGGATAYLSHRRLAILDRSAAARQPMVSACGRHWLTYNGEVYNFRDLRPLVTDAGVALRSHSDTEVLLELLAREGAPAARRFRGMFALAWWDASNARLTMVRDRFGIKPLVWGRPSDDLLLFASTPQALAASGLWRLRAAPGRRAEFLVRGSLPAGTSYWDGVRVVAPGTSVTVEAGRTSSATYWSLDGVWRADRPMQSVAEVAPAIRSALEESVGAHLISDVPVAVFLSGGLDSAAVAAAARAHTMGPLRSITVTMAGSALDEGAQARETSRTVGMMHEEIALADLDRDAILDEFFAAMPQPTVDGLNTFVVARAARAAGVQVALSGVGGDELLGGYPSFAEVPRLHQVLQAWGGALRGLRPVLSRWPSARMAKLAAIVDEDPQTLDAVWWAYRGLWSGAEAGRLSDEPLEAPPGGTERTADAFDVVRDLEWRQFLERQLLPDADAFTMCRALELRTPFVDHRVVEAVAAAGRWPRGARSTWKAALFDAWPDWASPAMRGRPKQGFVLPLDAWLRAALTTRSPRVWADVADRLRAPRYAAAVERFLSGRLHWSRLWALYVLDRVEAARR